MVTTVWTVDHLPVLNRNIPCEEDVKRWPHLRGIEFPKLDGKAIEILIGNDVPEAHWVFEQRRGRRKQPYAVRTPLGWTLIGPLGQTSSSVAQVNFVCGGQEMLSNQFKRLYDALGISESRNPCRARNKHCRLKTIGPLLS